MSLRYFGRPDFALRLIEARHSGFGQDLAGSYRFVSNVSPQISQVAAAFRSLVGTAGVGRTNGNTPDEHPQR